MQLINRLPMRNLLIRQEILLVVVPQDLEPLHRQLHLPHQRKVRLRPLPHDMAMTLDQVTIQPVNGQDSILEVLLSRLNFVAQAHRVLQSSQPVSSIALLLVVGGREIVRENNGRQEHRVANLAVALAEVLERWDNIRTGRALHEARGDAGFEGVGEHHLPAAGFALFADI